MPLKTSLRVLMLVAPLFLFTSGAPLYAQNVHDCPTGVVVRLSAPEAPQGGVLQAELSSSAPAYEVKAEWNKHSVWFWRDPGRNTYHAIFGVDLEQPVGKYEFAVSAKLASGSTANCSKAVRVTAGHYAVEKLRVEPKFVEPDPPSLERAQRERQKLEDLLARVSPQRLWAGRFRFPLSGPPRGGNFGKRRIFNGELRAPHTGLDIPAPVGTPIYAPQRGRVVMAEELFFTGNSVLLDHGLGVYSFYGHLSAFSAKRGRHAASWSHAGPGRGDGPRNRSASALGSDCERGKSRPAYRDENSTGGSDRSSRFGWDDHPRQKAGVPFDEPRNAAMRWLG